VLIAFVVSGCVAPAPPAPACVEDCTPPEPAAADGAAPTPSAPGPAELVAPPVPPSLAWESCTGTEVVVYVPIDQVDPLVPDVFRLDPTADRATLLFQFVSCPRVVTPDLVVNGSFIQVSVRVTPLNDSWDEPGSPSFYVLHLGVSDERVAQAARSVGAQATTARLERSSRPGESGLRIETWTFTADSGSVATDFVQQGDPSGGSKKVVHLWHPEGSNLRRVDDLKEFLNDQLFVQPVPLRVAGDLVFAAFFPPGGTTEALAQPYHHANNAWHGQAAVYPGSKP
jgi:hypothetical protein